MTNETAKSIVVHFLPSVGAEPLTLEETPTERIGYAVHSNEHGVLGWRVWRGRNTTLVARDHVLRIDLNNF